MGIPRVYRKSRELVIASYDFNEIASGTGFISFFLLKTSSDAGTINILTDSNRFFSSSIQSTQTPGNTTTTWDSSPFNLPRIIRGTAIFNLGTEGSTAGGDEKFEVQLFKWDGSSATLITSKFITTITDTATVHSIAMPCTETLIKKGEQLRLITKVIVVGGGEFVYWGHDPANRDGANLKPSSESTITSSRINVPFKIDL